VPATATEQANESGRATRTVPFYVLAARPDRGQGKAPKGARTGGRGRVIVPASPERHRYRGTVGPPISPTRRTTSPPSELLPGEYEQGRCRSIRAEDLTIRAIGGDGPYGGRKGLQRA
jgi:hypothetical protein